MARIAVALSGGVDSAVAAYLLQQQGHQVVGVSLLVWPDSRCCDKQSLDDARAVADRLGIPYRIYDAVPRFTEQVVDPFCAAYLAGRTPNPCPPCNAELKFGDLFVQAREDFGVEAIATGHYARLTQDPQSGRWQLRRGHDPGKDQTYMLYRLSQEQLGRACFPLGELTKVQTRQLAASAGLAVADKPDSQDACFVAGDVRRFLDERLGARIRPGRIVDREGRVLGAHPGIAHYTLGQRRGLGRGNPEPVYVVELRPATDELVVGPLAATFAPALQCAAFQWLSLPPSAGPLVGQVQIRHGARPAPATLQAAADGPGVVIRFAEPLQAVTPGQVAAFYQDELLVGGGLIERALPA